MNLRLAWADRLIAVISPDYVPSRYSPMEWASQVWNDPGGTKGFGLKGEAELSLAGPRPWPPVTALRCRPRRKRAADRQNGGDGKAHVQETRLQEIAGDGAFLCRPLGTPPGGPSHFGLDGTNVIGSDPGSGAPQHTSKRPPASRPMCKAFKPLGRQC
jgi:hypothetical protein